MAEPSIASGAESGKRRRPRSGKSAKGIKSAFVGRLVRGAVIVALAVSVVYSAQQLRLASLMFGMLSVGMPEQELLYLRGAPARKSADGRTWIYDEGSEARTIVKLNDLRTINSITCASLTGGSIGCPQVFGLDLGVDQDTLVDRLGTPTSERYIPNGKILIYSDLGVHFTMRQYRIAGVTKTTRDSRFAYLMRLPWAILP